MTTRPPAGIPRPPQRSLSGTGSIQRSTPQVCLSSPSALGRKSENFVDLTLDDSETDRHATVRLNTDMSKDSKEPPPVPECPKPIDVAPVSLAPRSPRGRPKTQFGGGRSQLPGANNSSTVTSIRGGENVTGQTPMPMPRRPRQSVPSSTAREQKVPQGTTVKKDVRPKPYVLTVPAAAAHYLTNGHADFFPWTGDHAEDQFTEHVIRHGFFDKSQTTQNETGSAKLSIFPALKHKSGLQSLSSVFANVLTQRRAHSHITSKPTFKPPPRVTLTDTKKETWLRDLANPSISLRRLSRTIPHGVRGKSLLEQCLSKNVPTERAVWLAKCVGANEIRAFKRKGVSGSFAMGGEVKWTRDWTVFVEQFVESIVTSCGESDWKDKIIYAVRLAAHLYAEHLLDREHYMDWLSTSLETCPIERVPVWLLITQVYWNDLLKYRRYGRRLVAALCSHLQTAHKTPDRDLLLPLIKRIKFLLQGLMKTHSESFICPKIWMKYRTTLTSCLSTPPLIHSPVYTVIDQRNARLDRSANGRGVSPRCRLVQLLDMSLYVPFTSDLANECRQVMPDLHVLTRTLLEWSTSVHRPGITKIYVGTRLLRTWSRLDVELNDEMLDFLGTRQQNPGLCKSSLYHLFSELARSGHFSISKYLQWLIARGGVRGLADMLPDGPCATRLLAELSTHDLPEGIDRLRQTMLSRASFSVKSERAETEGQIEKLEECFSLLSNQSKSLPNMQIPGYSGAIERRSHLTRAIKSVIGSWIRKQVSSHTGQRTAPAIDSWKREHSDEAKPTMTSSEFHMARAVLEDIEDLSMLADVLQIAVHSDDMQILGSAADTLSLHIQEFAAIGALNDLFNKLLDRLRSVAENSDPWVLLRSLSNVATRLPGCQQVARQLSYELSQCNRKSAVDARSPVSDHMAEVLQNTESEFSDEIEKIFASGTSMDHPTFERLFNMIISRMEATWTKPSLQQRDCAVLLLQLKIFDIKHFGILITAWLRKLLHAPGRLPLVHVVGPLIAIGCIEFKVVTTIIAEADEGNNLHSHPSYVSKSAFETLSLLIGTRQELNFMTVDDAYRLDIERLQFRKDFPREAIAIVRRAIESIASEGCGSADLVSLCRTDQVKKFIQNTVLTDFEAVAQGLILPLSSTSSSESREQIRDVIRSVLDPATATRNDSTSAQIVETVLHMADDFSLPFCQLELQLTFVAEASAWSNGESDHSNCLEAFERAVDLAIANENTAWTSIIPMLDIRIARHLCQRAERLLLDLVPSIKSESRNTTALTENEVLARRLLFAVDATIYSMQGSSIPELANQIAEKLNDIWHIVSQGDLQSQVTASTIWLPLMLDFITLHVNLFDNHKNGPEIRSRMLLSFSAFLLEFQTNSSVNTTPLLLQRFFDISLLLVDELADEARLQCVRILKDKTFDSGICYIFGYSAPPMDWLQLNQKGKLMSFPLRRWEILSEPTPNVGENDTSLSLTLFNARKV